MVIGAAGPVARLRYAGVGPKGTALMPAAHRGRWLAHTMSIAVASQVVKLKAFSKFDNTAEALAAASAVVDSKLSKGV